MTDRAEYTIESSRKWTIGWGELWQYRELFYFFTWRDVKVKYKQTWLGLLWVVLQPLLQVSIFTFTIGRLLGIQNSTGMPYPVFVFSGFLIWNMFSGSVNGGGNSMLTHAPIIKKIYFPRLIIPVSSILVASIDFCVSFCAFIIVLVFFQQSPDILLALIFWPLSFILLFLATVGVSCWLAALTVKYRDFRYIVPFGLQVALFITPIIYPISLLSNEFFKILLACNPVYAPVVLFRIPFTGIPDDFSIVFLSILSIFIFLFIGIIYFRKTESFFADIA